jgi:uncharacterized membrane protein HdeD (DUF308 family)
MERDLKRDRTAAIVLAKRRSPKLLLHVEFLGGHLVATTTAQEYSQCLAQPLVVSVVGDVSESAVAVSERDLPGRGWYAVLGFMSVIAGGIVLVWPFDSILVLTIVCGVSLVVLGVIQIVQAFQIRRDTTAARERFEALSERVAA